LASPHPPAPPIEPTFVADATDADTRLDLVIAAHLPRLSRSRIQKLIRDGHVRLSRGDAKPGLIVKPGLEVRVDEPAPTAASVEPEALPLTILYDDDDVVAIDKPAGMVVHPGAGHARGTIVNALLHHVRGLSGVGGEERPGIVHRLDKGTSGVMIVAKHDRAHRELARQFHDRIVSKEYLALVWGTPRAGEEFVASIGRDPRHRQKMSSRARHGRRALTRVLEVEPLGGVSLVRLSLATGRTHQIRVHLSEAGHPVVGDDVYGGIKRKLPPALLPLAKLERPFLHAARLEVTQPSSGARVAVESPLPEDLATPLATLRKAAAARRRS
jgi:23S rRNA pseudouridine1911/1915/1917 synthase